MVRLKIFVKFQFYNKIVGSGCIKGSQILDPESTEFTWLGQGKNQHFSEYFLSGLLSVKWGEK